VPLQTPFTEIKAVSVSIGFYFSESELDLHQMQATCNELLQRFNP
jgi:hypothetical protein